MKNSIDAEKIKDQVIICIYICMFKFYHLLPDLKDRIVFFHCSMSYSFLKSEMQWMGAGVGGLGLLVKIERVFWGRSSLD